MDINLIKTPGEFIETGRGEGYLVPCQAPHAIQMAMALFNVDFPTAYKLLIKMEILILVGKVYLVNLSFYTRLKK